MTLGFTYIIIKVLIDVYKVIAYAIRCYKVLLGIIMVFGGFKGPLTL